MSRKTLVTLSASVMLGAAIAAPSAALAQFGPPPGPPPMLAGPPPGLGSGGPPAAPAFTGLPPRGVAPRYPAGGPPDPKGAGALHGLGRGGQVNFRGVEDRAAAYGASSYIRNSYIDHGYGRGYRHWSHAAAYAYGESYASSDDECYDVSTYRRYGTRRVLVCHGD